MIRFASRRAVRLRAEACRWAARGRPARRPRRRPADARRRAGAGRCGPERPRPLRRARPERPLLADQGEHRPVVIRVGVHVEQPHPGPSSGSASAASAASSRPSEKFGTASRGGARPYSRSREGRTTTGGRRSTTRWYRGEGAGWATDRGAGTRTRRAQAGVFEALPASSARWTSRAAPASSRGTCPERSSASTRARGCLPKRRRQAPGATLVAGDALDLPFDGRCVRTRLHRPLLRPPEPGRPERFLAEARDGSRRSSWSSTRLRSIVPRRAGARPQRRRGAVVFKRFFTGAGLAHELGPGEVLHEGRWFRPVSA